MLRVLDILRRVGEHCDIGIISPYSLRQETKCISLVCCFFHSRDSGKQAHLQRQIEKSSTQETAGVLQVPNPHGKLRAIIHSSIHPRLGFGVIYPVVQVKSSLAAALALIQARIEVVE